MAFKRILCATDFSEGARRAMAVAGKLADDGGGELVIAHAYDVPIPAYAADIAIPQGFAPAIDDAKRGLAAALDEARGAGGTRRASSQLLRGQAWRAVVDAAETDRTIDLIVVGTHGRGWFSRVLLGSVAEQIVRHAPCSVLVVRPGHEPGPFRHVFVPTDLSDEARHAHERALELVRPGGRGITLFHAIEVPIAYTGEPMLPDLFRDVGRVSTEMLEDTAADLRARSHVAVTVQQHLGRAGSETLAALDADPTVDLVVMGSHGRTGLSRMLLGSVAEKVVRYAHPPVLVARIRSQASE